MRPYSSFRAYAGLADASAACHQVPQLLIEERRDLDGHGFAGRRASIASGMCVFHGRGISTASTSAFAQQVAVVEIGAGRFSFKS